MKDAEKVVVVWASTQENLDKGFVHIVNGFEGPRIYEKDSLDTRIKNSDDKDIPYALSWQEAVSFMDGDNIGRKVQLNLKTAKHIGLFK
jgi:hypothetical protein